MKLFTPLFLAAAVLLSGCTDSSTPLNTGYDRYQTYIYSEPSLNQHLYLDRSMNNLVSKAKIKPNTPEYKQVTKVIAYSIATKEPVCLKYRTRSSDTVTGLCSTSR